MKKKVIQFNVYYIGKCTFLYFAFLTFLLYKIYHMALNIKGNIISLIKLMYVIMYTFL